MLIHSDCQHCSHPLSWCVRAHPDHPDSLRPSADRSQGRAQPLRRTFPSYFESCLFPRLVLAARNSGCCNLREFPDTALPPSMPGAEFTWTVSAASPWNPYSLKIWCVFWRGACSEYIAARPIVLPLSDTLSFHQGAGSVAKERSMSE